MRKKDVTLDSGKSHAEIVTVLVSKQDNQVQNVLNKLQESCYNTVMNPFKPDDDKNDADTCSKAFKNPHVQQLHAVLSPKSEADLLKLLKLCGMILLSVTLETPKGTTALGEFPEFLRISDHVFCWTTFVERVGQFYSPPGAQILELSKEKTIQFLRYTKVSPNGITTAWYAMACAFGFVDNHHPGFKIKANSQAGNTHRAFFSCALEKLIYWNSTLHFMEGDGSPDITILMGGRTIGQYSDFEGMFSFARVDDDDDDDDDGE
jgi:hypothetical protein